MKCRLIHLGISIEDSSCLLCGSGEVSVEHLYFVRLYSAYVWKVCHLKLGLDPRRRCKLLQEASIIMNKFKCKDQLFALSRFALSATIWFIWQERLEIYWMFQMAQGAAFAGLRSRADSASNSFILDNSDRFTTHIGKIFPVKWLPPPPNWWKLNVDVSNLYGCGERKLWWYSSK